MTQKKYPQNFHTPKIFIFLKTQKNIEIQKFDPKKSGRAYVCMKISEYPPPPPWGSSEPLLLADAPSTKVSCTGLNDFLISYPEASSRS